MLIVRISYPNFWTSQKLSYEVEKFWLKIKQKSINVNFYLKYEILRIFNCQTFVCRIDIV